MEVICLDDTVAKLLHPTVWLAQGIVAAYEQLVKLYISVYARVTMREMINLFSLRIYEYAEAMRGVIRGSSSQPLYFAATSLMV